MENVATVIGKNIQKYMDAFGFTQVDLSIRLGCSPSAVRSWVRYGAMPRAKQIDEMCKIFNCSYDDLVSDQSGAKIIEDNLLNQIMEYAKRLTDEGKEKVLAYMNDLSGRYLK